MILFTEEEKKTRISWSNSLLMFFYFENEKTPCCREKIPALLDLKLVCIVVSNSFHVSDHTYIQFVYTCVYTV